MAILAEKPEKVITSTSKALLTHVWAHKLFLAHAL
jgi:hypothetical protein